MREENDSGSITLKYIYRHKALVIKWMNIFIDALKHRANVHDSSKLEEPELSGWEAMDLEPRYDYGTPEYFEKVNRYHWLLELHWRRNRHHPEYWQIWKDRHDMDLLDCIEMIVDWLSYSDKKLTYRKAKKLIEQQVKRYSVDVLFPPLSELIRNTIVNYFVDFDPGDLEYEDLIKKDHITSYKTNPGHYIDITV